MIRQFASFYLNGELFGIDVLLVREINQNLDITNVDPAPDYVVGLMNLRGQIITVIDLGVKLGFEKREINEESSCLVLKTNHELENINLRSNYETSNDIVGLLVDKIGDMYTVEEDEIEPAPANVNGVSSKYLEGIVKLEGILMSVLKVGKILLREEETSYNEK